MLSDTTVREPAVSLSQRMSPCDHGWIYHQFHRFTPCPVFKLHLFVGLRLTGPISLPGERMIQLHNPAWESCQMSLLHLAQVKALLQPFLRMPRQGGSCSAFLCWEGQNPLKRR
ncbi:hypothetical protein PAXRUDRAFT_457267 [Paxillus rubicundulus Ve08.2h10]|uniref:Unplaced genomic scaffold scaffold_293, whole genome shotgun sequence n=1 Tax=Paxillus rubicundulus Ve08.2h10 TaxID=930991 RepID=A0A0D0DWN4_9AGAM|nr:hypothetical protein PAXRUDRAFT_457267 [Paxillus rubicundulus Ve08.2h10]